MSLPSLAEVEHADWPTLQRLCSDLGLNPKGRSSVVRLRVLDHVRRRVRPELWRAGVAQQAALLTRLGHPDAGGRLWESTIHLDAPTPWIGLGQAQLGAGDLTEAAKSFERAAQMGDAAAHLHRAEALAAAGQYEGAVRACDAYLEARPKELRGVLLKAALLAKGGWTAEASTLLKDTFEAHPDAAELWKGLGTLLLRGSRFEPAAEAYREFLRASPDDAEAWIDRGAALLLAGRSAEAIGAFREVLEKDPRAAVALNNLGVAYLREGRTRPAGVTLERAAKHLETPQILRNLAHVEAALHPRRKPAPAVRRPAVRKPRAAAKPPRRPRSRRPPRAKPRAPAAQRPARTRKPRRAPRPRRKATVRRKAPRVKRARPKAAVRRRARPRRPRHPRRPRRAVRRRASHRR